MTQYIDESTYLIYDTKKSKKIGKSLYRTPGGRLFTVDPVWTWPRRGSFKPLSTGEAISHLFLMQDREALETYFDVKFRDA